jgi:ribosomal 50S subunit-recycling heat shock protein
MTRVRMDKWPWAAGFFKTRALAARACELGRIESNGQQAKASREVRVGELLQVRNDGGGEFDAANRRACRLRRRSGRSLTGEDDHHVF